MVHTSVKMRKNYSRFGQRDFFRRQCIREKNGFEYQPASRNTRNGLQITTVLLSLQVFPLERLII